MSGSDTVDTLTGPFANQDFVNSVLGPPIVGWTTSIMLYGFVIGLGSMYVLRGSYHRDPRWSKVVLWATFALASAQVSLQFWELYHYATWQQRDMNTLYAQTVVDCFSTLFVSLEAVLVQSFMAHRAQKLMARRWLAHTFSAVVRLGQLGSLAGSALYVADSFLWRANKPLPVEFDVASGIWLWCSAAVDIFITGMLIFLLRSRAGSGFQSTDDLLARLAWLAIESAAPVTISALVGAVFSYTVNPNGHMQNAPIVFWVILPPLYALGLLATLQGRAHLRDTTTVTGTQPRALAPAASSAWANGVVVGRVVEHTGSHRIPIQLAAPFSSKHYEDDEVVKAVPEKDGAASSSAEDLVV